MKTPNITSIIVNTNTTHAIKAKDIINIASVSANNDLEIGKIMAEAFQRVGKDGVITVEEGKSFETTVEFVEGMQFDRGYLSPHFAADKIGRASCRERV